MNVNLTALFLVVLFFLCVKDKKKKNNVVCLFNRILEY